jgi:hypothetical protein
MVTRRQAEANRTNARRSTGPRTMAGKQATSRNALRHGLNRPPDWADVVAWYRLVTGDPVAEPDVLAVSGSREALALKLAEAQAELSRVRALQVKASQDLLEGMETPAPTSSMALALIALKGHEKAKGTRDLGRYRRAAEARRLRALRAWIAVSVE